MFNPETGEWRQKDFQVFKDRKWLGHISYKSGEMSYKVPPPVVKGPFPTDYNVSISWCIITCCIVHIKHETHLVLVHMLLNCNIRLSVNDICFL